MAQVVRDFEHYECWLGERQSQAEDDGEDGSMPAQSEHVETCSYITVTSSRSLLGKFHILIQ
jgi:hypothetical protein